MSSLKRQTESLDKKKVVLGMSGGVDSTTAALLLQEKGYEVSGMYFAVTDSKIGEEKDRAYRAFKEAGCTGEFVFVDARDEFEKEIISNFCSEYLAGRTPNPCVICNPKIKFKHLIATADAIGAYHIATGHYARTIKSDDGIWHIKASKSRKDQSYMLYRLPSDTIKRLIFPLENILSKEEVRDIAREHMLYNADLGDSQEICFIEKGADYIEYIKDGLHKKNIVNKMTRDIHQYGTLNNKNSASGNCGREDAVFNCIECAGGISEGAFIDINGNVLGHHKGILNYTIGQRKGLGIALGRPAFVTDISANDNTVTLGENSDLFKTKVLCDGTFFTATGCGDMPASLEKSRIQAKIRYAAPKADATLLSDADGRVAVVFDEAQRAPAPGQSVVFYMADVVIGGGFICRS